MKSSRETTLGLWEIKLHIEGSTRTSFHVILEADIHHLYDVAETWLLTYPATLAFMFEKVSLPLWHNQEVGIQPPY